MLPAARFRSVVLLAPFACHPGFDRRRSNLPRRLREDRRCGGCGANSATWIGESLHSPEVAAQAYTIAEYEV
jgi:hypothetical protein